MTRPLLTPFFETRSVAVVGASADPSKVGGSVLANLRAGGFAGRIVPVNAARRVVQGLPAVASLRETDTEIDLAVIAVPAAAVLEVLEDCAARGVRGAVVISAGFREAGDEGRRRESARCGRSGAWSRSGCSTTRRCAWRRSTTRRRWPCWAI